MIIAKGINKIYNTKYNNNNIIITIIIKRPPAGVLLFVPQKPYMLLGVTIARMLPLSL